MGQQPQPFDHHVVYVVGGAMADQMRSDLQLSQLLRNSLYAVLAYFLGTMLL